MDKSEHSVASEIIRLLEQQSCWYDAFAHAPVRTSEEADALRPGYTLEQGAKALLVRVKIRGGGKQFAMIVTPGSTKFAAKKVKQALQASDLRFATEAEVADITGGIQPGGIPPFGNLFQVLVLVDPRLFEHETLVFNAGRNFTIAMRTVEYRRIVKPTVADIVE